MCDASERADLSAAEVLVCRQEHKRLEGSGSSKSELLLLALKVNKRPLRLGAGQTLMEATRGRAEHFALLV